MLKNILLSALGCMLLHFPVKAQLEKGTKYFGGTISFDGTRQKSPGTLGSKIHTININPSLQFGTFIKDNRLIGIGIGTSNSITKGSVENPSGTDKFTRSDNSYYLAPYIRHYMPLGAKWAMFLTSSAQVAWLNNKTKIGTVNDSENGFSVGLNIKPGIAYWITSRFSLESDINLLSLNAGYKDLADRQDFSFSSGVTSNFNSYLSVRASWYFKKQ